MVRANKFFHSGPRADDGGMFLVLLNKVPPYCCSGIPRNGSSSVPGIALPEDLWVQSVGGRASQRVIAANRKAWDGVGVSSPISQANRTNI